MEYFASTIVVFWIFAGLFWLATLAFIALDKDAKSDYRWYWFAGSLFAAPIILIPYFIWGRERNK